MATADQARVRMVSGLRQGGRLRSAPVEEAFLAVPRHHFLPDLDISRAYSDDAVATQFVDGVATSSASQPSMMAIMLEQLDLRPGHRVLEVGAGTGYNAALMAHIVGPAGAVTAVDIDADLVAGAARHLEAAGVAGVTLHCGDGALGYRGRAPYDRIVLTVGSPDVRPEWVTQLAPRGRLLLPLSVRGSQLSVALDLGPDGLLRSSSVRGCAFIRLRGVGASPATSVALPIDGLSMHAPGDGADPAPDPATLARVLVDEAGETTATGVRLGGADVWDGFGLWLAVNDPSTCRLTAAPEADPVADEWLPLAQGHGTVALAAPQGLAALVVEGAGSDGFEPAPPVSVRAYGSGREPAERLCTLLDGWVAAGRPTAAELRMTVVPRAAVTPVAGPGAAVLNKEHSRLLVGWAGGPA
jgi:protein-L-isoaspartate(D-aspartate) O-methyltransferase